MLNLTLASTALLTDLETTLRGLRDNPYFLVIAVVIGVLGIYTAFTMDKERP